MAALKIVTIATSQTATMVSVTATVATRKLRINATATQTKAID